MIKDTPYFKFYLQEVNESKVLASSSEDKLYQATSDYYKKIGVIKFVHETPGLKPHGSASNSVWVIKQDIFKKLDEEEQDLVTNVFDKNKNVLNFLLEEVALENGFVQVKYFNNHDEAMKWLTKNSNIPFLKSPTKAKLEDISMGAATTVLPVGLLSSLGFGLGSVTAVGTTVLVATIVSLRSLVSVPNRTREYIKETDFYELTEKGTEHLDEEINNEIINSIELEYLELDTDNKKVNDKDN